MDNVTVNHRVPQNAGIYELNFDPELDIFIFPLLSSVPYRNLIIPKFFYTCLNTIFHQHCISLVFQYFRWC
jgi:hypothetical protein